MEAIYSSLEPKTWWHCVRLFFDYSILQQYRDYLRTVLHKGNNRLLPTKIHYKTVDKGSSSQNWQKCLCIKCNSVVSRTIFQDSRRWNYGAVNSINTNSYFYIFHLKTTCSNFSTGSWPGSIQLLSHIENASDRDVGLETGKVTCNSLNKRCKGHNSFISCD